MYVNTWKCGELKLYISLPAGGLKKKKKVVAFRFTCHLITQAKASSTPALSSRRLPRPARLILLFVRGTTSVNITLEADLWFVVGVFALRYVFGAVRVGLRASWLYLTANCY